MYLETTENDITMGILLKKSSFKNSPLFLGPKGLQSMQPKRKEINEHTFFSKTKKKLKAYESISKNSAKIIKEPINFFFG